MSDPCSHDAISFLCKRQLAATNTEQQFVKCGHVGLNSVRREILSSATIVFYDKV